MGSERDSQDIDGTEYNGNRITFGIGSGQGG
jgi:hypothetical protein